MEHLESLIDERTRAILVNNPSNPCGSVYSEAHLSAILRVAEAHRVPIIADEIYENMCFGNNKFYPMASLTETVPILTVGGLAKNFLVPGWRLGWVIVYDHNGVLRREVLPALVSLSQLVLGANSLIQGALPDILTKTPKSFQASLIETLQVRSLLRCRRNAELTVG